MNKSTSTSGVVTLEIVGRIAVVRVNNPPVNALSHAVRAGLQQLIAQAEADAAVDGIVIVCAGRTFIAGADISEFGKPMASPSLREIIALLRSTSKPTLAAMHGIALGGGAEVALACRYRLALDGTSIGLPEVKLGLIPGAGGTVMLPLLVGPAAALAMIVSGAPVSAQYALEIGLVDEVAATTMPLLDSAIAFLERRLAAGDPRAAGHQNRSRIDTADRAAIEQAFAAEIGKARGLQAPIACVQAIRNAIELPFDAALQQERVIFQQLMDGSESKAQRHLFFAERAAGKVVDVPAEPRVVAQVGVIGAGTMGGGIAMSFVNGGYPVTIVDVDQAALDRGRATIEKNYGVSVSRGGLTRAAADERLDQISWSTDMAALAQSDLVVEAAYEEMGIKQSLFGQLGKLMKPGATMATNTSYLDINEIARSSGRPGDVIGMHFFSPANVMKLLEVVRGQHSSAEAVATAIQIGKKIGKIPVVVGVCHGFVGNRMLGARGTDSIDLLLEGATSAQIDKVFTDFGWPMGPFQMSDLAGLDISWRNRQALGQTMAIADELCALGRFGQKTGRGFYRYEQGSRTPVEDPEVTAMILAKAAELGVVRRDISAEEILERTHYPLINAGYRVLEEGIAQRGSDIDVVWVHGYGFPRAKGGPMFWSEAVGLQKLVERLDYWHGRGGKAAFKPAALLRQMADRPA